MRGRPRKPEWKKRRIPFSWRTTPDIRDRLIAAAEASGRSIAGEIEYRVQCSFANEDTASAVRAAVREVLADRSIQIDWDRNRDAPPPDWGDPRDALAKGWPHLVIADTHDCDFD